MKPRCTTECAQDFRRVEAEKSALVMAVANPRTGLDVVVFEELLKSQPIRALVVTPTVSNPLGSVMSDEDRERLVKITRRYDVPIIEDDVYAELVFDGSRPRPLRAFAGPSEDSHVLLVGSVSKTLAPGYRVGWLAGGRWHDQILRLKFSHTLACPTLPGMAVAEFLASGGYDRGLMSRRKSAPAHSRLCRRPLALSELLRL